MPRTAEAPTLPEGYEKVRLPDTISYGHTVIELQASRLRVRTDSQKVAKSLAKRHTSLWPKLDDHRTWSRWVGPEDLTPLHDTDDESDAVRAERRVLHGVIVTGRGA